MFVNDIDAMRVAMGNADPAMPDEEITKQFVLEKLKTAKKMRAWVGKVDSVGALFDLPTNGNKHAIAGRIAGTIEEVKRSQAS